jgi:hypothetical protein
VAKPYADSENRAVSMLFLFRRRCVRFIHGGIGRGAGSDELDAHDHMGKNCTFDRNADALRLHRSKNIERQAVQFKNSN